MNTYVCPECKKRFFECELINFKCSENHVGPEIQDWCPNCIKKYNYAKLEIEPPKDYKKEINDIINKVKELNF